MENTIPTYFVDTEKFYLNPAHSSNRVLSAEPIPNNGIPVRLFTNGEEVKPRGIYPKWVQEAGVSPLNPANGRDKVSAVA